MRLPDGDLDTAISGLGGLIGSRYEQVVLSCPADWDRVTIAQADEPVADRRRPGEWQCLRSRCEVEALRPR